MRALFEGLTATHDAKFFLDEAARLGNPIRKGVRGNVLNQGEALTAVHPVIRTNRKFPPLYYEGIFTCQPDCTSGIRTDETNIF